MLSQYIDIIIHHIVKNSQYCHRIVAILSTHCDNIVCHPYCQISYYGYHIICSEGWQICGQNCTTTHRFRDICQLKLAKLTKRKKRNGRSGTKKKNGTEKNETKDTKRKKRNDTFKVYYYYFFLNKDKCKQHFVNLTLRSLI